MKKFICLVFALLILINPMIVYADGAEPSVIITFIVVTNENQPVSGVSLSGSRDSDTLQEYGITDQNGKLTMNLYLGEYDFTAEKKGTKQTLSDFYIDYDTQQIQFQTTEAKVKVINSDKKPLKGARVMFLADDIEFELGISDYEGIVSTQLFSGKFVMSASYQNIKSKSEVVDISNSGLDHTFLIEGSQQNNDTFTVKLLSSQGKGLKNGVVSYYHRGWIRNAAVTDANGVVVLRFSNDQRPTVIGIEYKGGWQQQNISKEQTETVFATKRVTFGLLSSKGRALVGSASYYARGWRKFGLGTTTTKKSKPMTEELLPGIYTFGIEYEGGYMQKAQNISADPNVIFRTVLVKFSLLSSKGKKLKGQAKYYARGWRTFGKGVTTAKMELLPAKYTFGITYKGGYMQKVQDVSKNREVVFRTVNVTFKIYTENGRLTTGEASYYAKGWKAFGKGNTRKNANRPLSMQMLPVPYTFAAILGSQRQQKKQDVGVNPNIEFIFDTSDSAFNSQITNCDEYSENTYLDALRSVTKQW